MRKTICKIIVYLFFVILYGIILFIINDMEVVEMILALIGSFSISMWIFKLIEWLFKEKKDLNTKETN